MRIIWQVFLRECLQAYRERTEIIKPFIFFLIMVTLFPLALNPDPKILTMLAPGIIWIGILLMTLLSLERLFRHDADLGIIEQWLAGPQSFIKYITGKLIAHWLLTYLPVILLAPLLAVWLDLSLHQLLILYASFLLATPALSFGGAIFTALTVQLKQAGLLLALLILPLYIPVLIFAASAVSGAASDLQVTGQLAFLGAISVLTIMISPWLTAAALKIGLL